MIPSSLLRQAHLLRRGLYPSRISDVGFVPWLRQIFLSNPSFSQSIRHSNHQLVTLLASATLACCATTALLAPAACEDNNITQQVQNEDDKEEEENSVVQEEELDANPLWPPGISEEAVGLLVDEILNDPSINIAAIPDHLERQIYQSIIRLVINSVYESLSSFHGQPFLGHALRIRRSSLVPEESTKQTLTRMRQDNIDEDLLEQVAERLLANRVINNPMVPDVIERQVYVNCIKLVFRILDLLAASFRVTVCGHEFTMHIAISEEQQESFRGEMVQRAIRSTTTPIDLERVRQYARHVGVEEMTCTDCNWWERIVFAWQRKFLAQLHATMYLLILGIVDDVLANTEIALLSDRIRLDIVPDAKERGKKKCTGSVV